MSFIDLTATIINSSSVTYLGGGGGSDQIAQYLLLTNTGSLPLSRRFFPGTGLKALDAGGGSSYTVSINDTTVATVSGTTFTGVVLASAAGGITGSVTQLRNGTSFIAATGTGLTVTTSSTGQIQIQNTNTTFDTTIPFVTIGNPSGLSAERALTAGTGIKVTDGGANSSVTLSVDNSVVAMVSGTTFTGPIKAATGQGITGSITKTAAGLSLFVAGTNVAITSGSSTDQIVISATPPAASGDADASYLCLGTSTGLTSERVFTPGTDISATDNGANGTYVLNNTAGFDRNPSYLTLAATGSLNNERVLTQGTGVKLTDAGANSTATLSIDNNVVATISGTTFTGGVQFNSGLTGSLLVLPGGTSYIAQGTGISVVSSSAGQVRINNTKPGDDAAPYAVIGGSVTSSLGSARRLVAGADITFTDGGAGSTYTIANGAGFDRAPSYLTLANTGSLDNERVLTAGTGITFTDGGAGSTLTINASGGGFNPFSTMLRKAASFSGSVNTMYVCNTAAANVTCSLPSTHAQGDWLWLTMEAWNNSMYCWVPPGHTIGGQTMSSPRALTNSFPWQQPYLLLVSSGTTNWVIAGGSLT